MNKKNVYSPSTIDLYETTSCLAHVICKFLQLFETLYRYTCTHFDIRFNEMTPDKYAYVLKSKMIIFIID